MNRRHFSTTLLALALAGSARAQADDTAPLVAAPKIIEALGKDVVLDRDRPAPGAPARPAPQRHSPSISLQVQFTFGSAELLPHGKRQLDQLAMALNDSALAAAAFELAGHTDAVGDAESNLRLSLDRANAVKDYLVQVHGLNPGRLQTIGFGFSRLANAANPQAAVNRRVEVRRLGALQARPVPGVSPAAGGRLVPTPN